MMCGCYLENILYLYLSGEIFEWISWEKFLIFIVGQREEIYAHIVWFFQFFKHNKGALDTELKNTKTTYNTTNDVENFEWTYKGFDELDNLDEYIQDEIDVS